MSAQLSPKVYNFWKKLSLGVRSPCHSIRSMFRVLGIYNFARALKVNEDRFSYSALIHAILTCVLTLSSFTTHAAFAQGCIKSSFCPVFLVVFVGNFGKFWPLPHFQLPTSLSGAERLNGWTRKIVCPSYQSTPYCWWCLFFSFFQSLPRAPTNLWYKCIDLILLS